MKLLHSLLSFGLPIGVVLASPSPQQAEDGVISEEKHAKTFLKSTHPRAWTEASDQAFDQVMESLVMRKRGVVARQPDVLEVEEEDMMTLLEEIKDLEDKVIAMLPTGDTGDEEDEPIDTGDEGDGVDGCSDDTVSDPLSRRIANCAIAPVDSQAFVEVSSSESSEADEDESVSQPGSPSSSPPDSSISIAASLPGSISTSSIVNSASSLASFGSSSSPTTGSSSRGLETVTFVSTKTREATMVVTQILTATSTLPPARSVDVAEAGVFLQLASDEEDMDDDDEDEMDDNEDEMDDDDEDEMDDDEDEMDDNDEDEIDEDEDEDEGMDEENEEVEPTTTNSAIPSSTVGTLQTNISSGLSPDTTSAHTSSKSAATTATTPSGMVSPTDSLVTTSPSIAPTPMNHLASPSMSMGNMSTTYYGPRGFKTMMAPRLARLP